MKISAILLILIFLSASVFADTEYFGTELTVEGYAESEWSDPVNITIEENNTTTGNSTVFFGTEVIIENTSIGDNNSTGPGWIPSHGTISPSIFLLIFAVVLFPVAIFVKYGNGKIKVIKWKR